MAGPLTGLRIIEIAGIGPGPFAGMMLADHGAEVIRVERPGVDLAFGSKDVLTRSRRIVVADLKTPEGIAFVRDLVRSADGLIEGFRPGVMERLGLGPDVLLGDNPSLVYGRMTGWGQDGPYAASAGHDINYIALAGVLHGLGPIDKPMAPINLVGDFGGGGMMLAFGMVSALWQVKAGGAGQVIDCAMTDGAAVLMNMMRGFVAQGMWRDERGSNLLDGAAHFYDSYETSDGKYVSIGSIEPQFYHQLRDKLELTGDAAFDDQMNPAVWPVLKERLAAIFKSRTRDEWCTLMEGTDICFAPVLSMTEATTHPHNVARGTFVTVDGVVQAAPTPRYSATPNATPRPSAVDETAAVFAELNAAS